MRHESQPQADRAEVKRLAYLMVDAMDSCDPTGFARCLDDDVEIDYGFGSWRGRMTHERVYLATLPRLFTATQHMVTNALIDIAGDIAKARYQVHATHVAGPDNRVARIGLTYRQTAVRKAEGWRIRSHRARQIWMEDPAGILAGLGDQLRLATADVLRDAERGKS